MGETDRPDALGRFGPTSEYSAPPAPTTGPRTGPRRGPRSVRPPGPGYGPKAGSTPPGAGRFRHRRERPPTPGYAPGDVVSRAFGGLLRGPQARETAAADPQDLAVGALAGDVVLPGGEWVLAEGHPSLVDQPAGLRA